MSSRSSSSSPVNRKRLREQSEDRITDRNVPQDTPLAPSTGTSRGAMGIGYGSFNTKMLTNNDGYTSDSSEDGKDRDQRDPEAHRMKKLKKVDTSNPFSTFERQTRNKKKYTIPSSFARENWLKMRGMDDSGKFLTEQDARPDAWKDVSKSDRLVRRFSGEVFADSKLDDGLHSIVNKHDVPEDKDLVRSQKTFGSIGHLCLTALESFGRIYKTLGEFVSSNLGPPETVNPEWTEGSDLPQLVHSGEQMETWTEFQEILKELQVDVAEPISNVARISASSFTHALDARREKVLSVVKKNNNKAANAISRIPPSASSLFGGDHTQLEKVVKLTKDLSAASNSRQTSHHQRKDGKDPFHGSSKKTGSNKPSERSGKDLSKNFRGNGFRGKRK